MLVACECDDGSATDLYVLDVDVRTCDGAETAKQTYTTGVY